MLRKPQWALLLGLLVSMSGPSSGTATAQGTILPIDNVRWDRTTQRQKIMMAKVRDDVLGAEDKRLVLDTVQHLIHPLTDPDVKRLEAGESKQVKDPKTMRVVRKYSLVYYTTDPKNGALFWIDMLYGPIAKNEAMLKELDARFLESFSLILQNKRQDVIVQINAALVLAHFASKTRDPATADLLLKNLESPVGTASNGRERPDDGLRLYALRGLKNLLAQPKSPVTAEQRAKIADALVTFVLRAQPVVVTTTAREKRLLDDGFRYLRREAVRALAHIDQPSVALKDGKVIHPAEALLRVTNEVKSEDKLSPAPRLDERMDAVIGLLRMRAQTREDRNYQPEAAAVATGFVLKSLVDGHNLERQEKGAGRPRFPYKIYAVRIKEALRDFAKNNNVAMVSPVAYDETKSPIIGGLVNRAIGVLEIVQQGLQADDRALNQWTLSQSNDKYKKAFRSQ